MDHSLERRHVSSPTGVSLRSGTAHRERQKAEVEIRLTRGASFRAHVDVSSGGLLSIAALVSSILLSTAVLVHVATRDAKSKSIWR
jgi:hypothetical protein